MAKHRICVDLAVDYIRPRIGFARGDDAIELLQERRTAMISAAVTGKIDVRGLVKMEVV